MIDRQTGRAGSLNMIESMGSTYRALSLESIISTKYTFYQLHKQIGTTMGVTSLDKDGWWIDDSVTW